MENFDITTRVEVYSYAELPHGVAPLVEAARQATYRSYAPYSHFNVGAAIRLESGAIVTGANQENAAFSSGTCAERSACFYAGAEYPGDKFEAVAIAARDASGRFVENPIPPCGSCRQSLLEYETLAGHDVTLWLAGADRVYRVNSVKALLPLSFTQF